MNGFSPSGSDPDDAPNKGRRSWKAFLVLALADTRKIYLDEVLDFAGTGATCATRLPRVNRSAEPPPFRSAAC
jgi:hypothetical protein